MIKCTDLRCKYYKDCKCTCKNVNLTYWSIHTLYNGVKDMLECKSFEYSKKYLEMKEKLEEILGEIKSERK